MPKTAEYTCQACGTKFPARVADRKRGWAKFCSKRCKARDQESRTGLYKKFLERKNRDRDDMHEAGIDGLEDGWDGHKNAF